VQAKPLQTQPSSNSPDPQGSLRVRADHLSGGHTLEPTGPMVTTADPGRWRLCEADSLDAMASRLEQIVVDLDSEAQHLVPAAAGQTRQLAALYRVSINEWRSEARRQRIAADQ
jgi:hypothetical protein